MKLDEDIRKMNSSQRGQELARLRRLIRTHKKKKNNARCWLNDKNLYKKALPEGAGDAGRMTLPLSILIQECKKYIQGQQCDLHCPIKAK